MSTLSWPELKQRILKLEKSNNPVVVERLGTIIDEELFIKTHITVVDKYPQTTPRTHANNRARLIIAKPHFDRLMAYYLLKTEF